MGTELPIIVKTDFTFNPGMETKVVFEITESKEKTPYGVMARTLLNCEIRAIGKFNLGTQRLFVTNANLICGKNSSNTNIEGQLVGDDKKMGIKLDVMGVLKKGTAGLFVLTSTFN
jgi:hypothetical protein